jgi:hypothetical protein
MASRSDILISRLDQSDLRGIKSPVITIDCGERRQR